MAWKRRDFLALQSWNHYSWFDQKQKGVSKTKSVTEEQINTNKCLFLLLVQFLKHE